MAANSNRVKEPPSIGYTAGGRRYEIADPDLLRSADADLWNDRMYLQIDHRGHVRRNGFLAPDLTQYSEPLRTFYLRDNENGRIWTVPPGPIRASLDGFLFSAGKADLSWTVLLDGLECEVKAVIPPDNLVELWCVKVRNCSAHRRVLSLFSYFPVGKLSWFRQTASYDPETRMMLFQFFPYYVNYQDYYALLEGWKTTFVLADIDPQGYMFSVDDFTGHGTQASPDALKHPQLPRPDTWADADSAQAGIFQFDRELESGGEFATTFAIGPAREAKDIQAIACKYLVPGGFEKALADSEKLYSDFPSALDVRTPDPDFDAYVNHWLPRRALMMVHAMRFMSAPQGRNLLQDSMGGALVDPESSRKWFCLFYSFQKADGWLPHGMPLSVGASQIRINTIPHKDINSWGPSALSYYIFESGDELILDENIPFADTLGETATLHEHVCRGLEWLLADRTDRGLSRIGQGDWNDPLNMAGKDEKGESVWLSEALSLALDTWAPFCETRGETGRALKFRGEAAALRAKINELAWDGRWYIRGFTDAGIPFGTSSESEGRIFLNAQSWAIICGAADAERTESCIRSVEELLGTPYGPMTLAPAYTRMREDIGKLTQKAPGRLENGSVYCHAATFYAYALYKARRPDHAYRILRNMLAGSPQHSVERAGQPPLYIPNAYLGTACGYNAGKSTHSPNTGTAPWYYRTVVDCMFGLRAERNGLRVDPQLPGEWASTRALRRWRGAVFDVKFTQSPQADHLEVELNGKQLGDCLIPVQPPGSSHAVRVRVPCG